MPEIRRKPVPPAPDSLDRVRGVRRALPLVPGSVEDCCARLVSRAGVPSQDEARAWITFLAALGLAEETDRGFVRTREPADPDRAALADRFREGVYGARELLGILADDGPLSGGAAFEQFREHVPRWERHRSDAWEREWAARTERLLSWAVLLGLAVESDGEYDSPG